MRIGSFNQSEVLIVADSTHHNSRVLLYGPCINDEEGVFDDDNDENGDVPNEKVPSKVEATGRREYITDVIDELRFPYNSRRGATHPYGIAQDVRGNIYASFQDSDSVLRFTYDPNGPYLNFYGNDKNFSGSFVPMASPDGLIKERRKSGYDFFNGTFVALDRPKAIGGTFDLGIRAIEFVKHRLWVADEQKGIRIYSHNGEEVGHIKFKRAVGLLYVKSHKAVYATSRRGKVKAFHYKSFRHLHSLPGPAKKWVHPTGLGTFIDLSCPSSTHCATTCFFYP